MPLDCNNINNIEDITDQINYEDKKSGGLGDSDLVSCGQSDGYNELKDKYNRYFSDYDEEFIAKKMCLCCKTLKPTGREKVTWKEFYKCLKQNITFSDLIKNNGFTKILDGLIARK